jgi:PTS system N-acetylglucosamine-specific IIC component
MKFSFSAVQQLGRALMLPIAVLPVAGLLLRLGQPDLLGVPAIAAAGDAIFSNLGLIFAVGVAVGLARENHGAAGLAALVGYLVTTQGAQVLLNAPPAVLAGLSGPARELALSAFKAHELSKMSVPAGLLSGITAGILYNRCSDFALPSYLAFFGGRRFVPIASGVAGLVAAFVFGFGWPVVEHGMDVASRAILGAGSIGLFAYGVLNRVLIVTGLHHILNNFAWFLLGDYHGVTGDLKRFFAGDPSAGAFMSGFFPVMMFGLPGACLAMYHSALPARRKAVGGLLLSLALTSFLTGVTEPVEFTFIFLAPWLYVAHGLATGLSMVAMNVLGVRLGFSFSAGLVDYVLNFNRATRPLLLLPVGAVFFAIYYGVFRFCIQRFNLATPGRDTDDAPVTADSASVPERGAAFVAAVGGAGNLTAVDACTTRLRLEVIDSAGVDERALVRLGARGVIRPSATTVQVVVGPEADQVATAMRRALHAAAAGNTARPMAAANPLVQRPAPAAVARTGHDAGALLAALGGRGNIISVEPAHGRLLVKVKDRQALDEVAIGSVGLRGLAIIDAHTLHLLVAGAVEDSYQALRALLA